MERLPTLDSSGIPSLVIDPRWLRYLTLTIALWLPWSSWAVPLELSYTGQLTDQAGNPLTGQQIVRFTFYPDDGAGQPNTSVPLAVTLLNGPGGLPLTVPNTFLPASGSGPNCGQTSTYPSCASLSLSVQGVFNVGLYLSAAHFHTLFPETNTLRAPWIEAEVGTVSGTTFTPSATIAAVRQRFSVAPYCLKVPVDGATLVYDGNGQMKVGTLSVTSGGTGRATLTAGSLLLGNGTSAVTLVGPGAAGQIPISSGSTIVMQTVGGDGSLSSDGTLILASTGISPGTFTRATVTVDGKGRLTSASNGGAIALASDVTGTLSVANGGTGRATLTSNAVLTGNGTGAVNQIAPGTSGNVLTSNGTGWVSQAPASSLTCVTRTCTPGNYSNCTASCNAGETVTGVGCLYTLIAYEHLCSAYFAANGATCRWNYGGNPTPTCQARCCR